MTDLNALDLPSLFEKLVRSDHLESILRIAVEEDLGELGDVTTAALERADEPVVASVVSRTDGVLSGRPVIDVLLLRFSSGLKWNWFCEDGAKIQKGDVICEISGTFSDLLPIERLILNMLGRLSGVASLTARFVAEVAGCHVLLCDTRKTTPGLRTLEKYAVRCGGGYLHRIGLFDAFLLKDNHVGSIAPGEYEASVREAIRAARNQSELRFVEVEVDSLDQLDAILAMPEGTVDIVLLDNMEPARLKEAVARRNEQSPRVLLEASGGITLKTIAAVAATGVDRIAVGALTHSSVQLDFGLDLK